MTTHFSPGDVVLIGYDYPMTREQGDDMVRNLERWFPGVTFHLMLGTVQGVYHPLPKDVDDAAIITLPPEPWTPPSKHARWRGDRRVDDGPDVGDYDPNAD